MEDFGGVVDNDDARDNEGREADVVSSKGEVAEKLAQEKRDGGGKRTDAEDIDEEDRGF